MEMKFKDSGIEWIGRIPETWEVTKLNTLYTQRIEKVSDKDYPPLSVTMQGILPQLENAAKTNNGDDRKLVRVGDFAINSRSDRRGSCGISPYEGSVSLINTILKPRNEMNPRYYNWLFHSSLFSDEFYKWGHGIVDDLWTTRWQEMRNITVPSPTMEVQKRIADYLDEKCGEIDLLIGLQVQMIEKLKAYKQSVITEAVTKGLNPKTKLVPSGIDWIGEIPEGWKIFALKWLMELYAGATPKSDNLSLWDGDIPWITPADYKTEDIYVCGGRRNISQKGFESCATTILPKGSIIFSKRAPIGLVAINSQPLCTNQGCIGCIVNQKRALTKFYYYTLSIFKEQFELFGSGTTFKEISATKFADFNVPVPPLSEQSAIASYLDSKCADIDHLISMKQQKIEKLKEYKKSIIYEAVTGKTIIE